MNTVTGRLTADAQLKELEDGRKVINFTMAQNDRFKPKGANEVKQVTNFFDCSYWGSIGIAEHLKKGMLIEATGRIGVNVWTNMDGDARARLTLHVQHIQLHGSAKAAIAATNEPKTETQS